MYLLGFLLVSFVILMGAYLVVGRALARVFNLSSEETTPAHTMRDGLDYEPARTGALLPQHFSAIAAAGPIVGPILAATYFGWGPAWIWIILGSILIGGIHDFTALLASVRHKARSVAEIVREYMNPRAHLLFLIFIWFALVYVIIAFADVTAGTFVAASADGEAPGPGVATSSILYLLVAVAMGLALRFGRMNPVKAKLVFIPLVLAAIVAGPYLPLDLKALTGAANPQRIWGYILLGYCFFAAIAPVWSLLQPRGELGGYFLYIIIGVAVVGVTVGALTGSLQIHQPFFKGWTNPGTVKSLGYAAPIFPILFITVACGACSGFHSIVASGTTSKQLSREADARPVAYGSMLMEGFFACISLATVMILTDLGTAKPDMIYAQGIREFSLAALKPLIGEAASGAAGAALRATLLQFALLCFATFVFDTLDACTRLARYVLMELFGWTSRGQALAATALSLALPAAALSMQITVGGKVQPLWSVFWNIFGSSNQLLAALTLIGVTVWLARKGYPYWIALGPAIFMMGMTLWSLVISVPPYLTLLKSGEPIETFRHMQFVITLSLIGLALWLVFEALLTWRQMRHGGKGDFNPSAPSALVGLGE